MAYIIQSGFLSKPINIQRGCRQGDPIALYLFILVAEILTLLIQNNPAIVGINVGHKEIKLSQFADDTTILLDGSEKSLQATLNTLEIYGDLSGLKVNTEKTKLIWIGSLKKSSKKLKVNQELCWGETKFSLLGLQFSANLNEMTEINFETAIKKAKTELKSWKYRTLSPIGKIAVLKSLILPKFVHLFSSIPASQSTIAEINTIFYSFLWGNKPDKIKREVICKDYLDGGLRMINLFNFEKAQKIKWLKYILQKEQHTYNLFLEEMRNLESITLFGGEYCAKFCKLLNPFWKAVFMYWAEFCASQQIKSNEDISNSALWFNKDLATNDIHLPNWSKKGINFVHDIIDTNGNVLPLETLSEKFSLKINFLHYFTVQGLVKKFIAKYKKGDQFDSIKPFVPFHLKNVVKSQQNKKLIYQSLCKSNDIKLSNDIKWNTELGLEIDKTMWKNLNKACFYTIKDNMYIWLQCRIIKRILGTNSFLKKAKISNNDLCRICHE